MKFLPEKAPDGYFSREEIERLTGRRSAVLADEEGRRYEPPPPHPSLSNPRDVIYLSTLRQKGLDRKLNKVKLTKKLIENRDWTGVAKDIAERSIKSEAICGVYFLLQDDVIVYVGQSIDVDGRLATHRRGTKRFDRYAILRVPAVHLDQVERTFIHMFRPQYNDQLPSLTPSEERIMLGLGRDADVERAIEHDRFVKEYGW